MYINEGMINGTFNPADYGFMYYTTNPLTGGQRQWVLWRQWDVVTLTNTSSPATRLANWKLERQKFLRTNNPLDMGYETVYQVP